MSKGWGGKRANSGRHKVTQKVQYLRYPLLKPDNLEALELLKWWRDRKPERRTALLLEMIKKIKNSEAY